MSRWKSLPVLAVGFLVVVVANTANAADDPLVVGDVTKAPAPPWLKPGMRITVYAGSGTIQRGGRQTTPSQPGQPGAFWDPRVQQWVVAGAPEAGAATSLSETQVIAVENGKAYVMDRPLIRGIGSGGWHPNLPHAFSYPVGDAGDKWKSPALLQAQPDVHSPQFWRGKSAMNWKGKKLQVILMQGADMSWCYDLDSGLLLTCNSQIRTPNSMVPGDETVTMAAAELVGLRETKYPWVNKPAPDWIKTVKTLSYRQTIRRIDMNAERLGLKTRAEVIDFNRVVMERGTDWLATVAVSPQPGADGKPQVMQNTAEVSGAGSTGLSVWLPPSGLAGLKPGQTLDTDATTGLSTVVRQTANGADGSPIIVLTESGSGYQFDVSYDLKTGRLVSSKQQLMYTGFERDVTELTLTGVN